MPRTIKIDNSDFIVCKYFDNGYCRFLSDCKFYHSKEECFDKKCNRRGCQKRHPKGCSFHRRNKCKFIDKCAFKHEAVIHVIDEEFRSENARLKQMVQILKSEKEDMKKEIEKKSINKITKDLEKDIESLNAQISKLKEENLKKEMLLKSQVSRIKCGICSETFNSENQFKVHSENKHKEISKCQACDKSSEIMDDLKDDIKVLRSIGKSLMDEKKKHKFFCNLSEGCLHQGTCPDDCCYTTKVIELPESDFDKNDVKRFRPEEEEDSKNNPNLKCKECEFVAKNSAGLTKHKKMDHNIQCEKCDLSTTTKLLLNQHIKENHK